MAFSSIFSHRLDMAIALVFALLGTTAFRYRRRQTYLYMIAWQTLKFHAAGLAGAL